ncbi:MAG TPA: peptide deformylase [Thiothrix sp.]|nr:peptide deformylase [Thiothrix sp.]
MALLEILHYPDTRLRKKAATVHNIDQRIKKTVNDMLETMYNAPGIGLAATQVNIHQRIVVIDISEKHNEPLCLINPEIIDKAGQTQSEEGCLSVPEYYAEVTRAETVKIKALNKEGNVFELEAEGILAICIQHEIDHLDGKVFVDYLSPLKQQRVRKKLEKLARKAK